MRHTLPVAALILSGVPAPASTASAEETVRSDEVRVTATRVARELHDVPMSVSVMTAEDIRKSSARTVGELLEDVPGVQIQNSGSQGLKRVSIRGESPNRVLVLIDGQKIAENKSMDGTAVLIDPSMIERVEVIKGPASVLYGSEALGGVVNIITKKGGDEPVQGEAGTGYNGSSDGFSSNLGLFGRTGGFSYRANGSYEDHRTLKTPEGNMPHSAFRQKEGSLFLGYDFSDRFSIGGGVDMFDSTLSAGSMEPGYENFSVELPEWKRNKVNFFAEAKNLTDYLARVRLDAFWQESEKHMINTVDVDGMPMVLVNDADNKNRQLGASLQTDWQIGERHYLIAGYDFNHDALDADTTANAGSSAERVMQIMGIPLPSVAQRVANMLTYRTIARHEGDMDTHALYAQMESRLPGDFTLSYGLRYTWVHSEMSTASGTRFDYQGNASANQVGDTGSSSESHPVFNVGLVWTGIDDLALRATFSQGFRVANLQEKYVLSAMGGGIIYPNADLDPETSNNYEIGARYDNGKLILDASVFYNDARDYIATVTIDAATDTSRYINVGKARTRGLELAAGYTFDSGFTPYATLTWMKRKYDYGTWETCNVGQPEFFGRAGLRYEHELPKNVLFRADAYARFATASREDSRDEDGVISRTDLGGGWGTANFSAGIDFGDKRQYSLTAELLNIFDRTYRITDSIYEPGLHANVLFSYRF